MSYGILCVGNKDQTIIDDENSLLHVMSSGSYAAASPNIKGCWIYVNYNSAINSPRPPLVFISPDGAGVYFPIVHAGSAGAWTGFSVYFAGDYPTVGLAYSGRYCACVAHPPATGGYGMQVFDKGGQVVFDSNYKVMRFVGGVQDWVSSYYVDMSFVFRVWVYSLAWTYGKDSYFLMNMYRQDFLSGMSLSSVSVGFPDVSRATIELSIVTGKVSAPKLNWPLLVGVP
ncbi:hypothetical protein [Pseudomonas sp. Q1]|uniref:hypothetical protein n=1 Tax=Pseudomonas sp. Q1 TaxID=2202823 RepID=UPI0013752088|nr:hypothetical protein [Pseudomonas sp. Q1]